MNDAGGDKKNDTEKNGKNIDYVNMQGNVTKHGKELGEQGENEDWQGNDTELIDVREPDETKEEYRLMAYAQEGEKVPASQVVLM